MGMFDSVYVDCPHCGAKVEFQSKEWHCNLDSFSLSDAPVPVLYDIMNEPEHCERCDGWLALVDPAHPPGPRPRPNLQIAKVKTPPNPRVHPQGMKWRPDNARPFSYSDLSDPSQLGKEG